MEIPVKTVGEEETPLAHFDYQRHEQFVLQLVVENNEVTFFIKNYKTNRNLMFLLFSSFCGDE
jgi:hypothetical protein